MPTLYHQTLRYCRLNGILASSVVALLAIFRLAALAASGNEPPPSPEEQAGVISATRTSALRYSDGLPDFICTQVTRRWIERRQANSTTVIKDPEMKRPWRIEKSANEEDWKLKDTLTIQLSYFGQKEQYQLLLVNGKRAKQGYESVDGATSYGDFGSALGILFQQSSHAAFAWDHWGVLGGRRVMVFTFAVIRENSQWRLGYESKEVVTAFKGRVFIEPSQRQVLKLEVSADDIPKNFPIEKSGVELDYRLQPVGDQEFLLPLRAVAWNETRTIATKNEAEFHRYRKFAVDSKVEFDTPAPLPEDQTKETIPK
jgi:hypothetical protein